MHNEEMNKIIERLDHLEKILKGKQKNSDDVFLDNSEFIRVMNISKRTASQWRQSKLITYSQIKGKLFYRMKDIQILLDKHQHKAINK